MSKRNWIITAIVVVIAVLIAIPILRGEKHVTYLGSKVERGEINDVVESTGVVNAVVNVQVGSQVSGTISKLHADFNSRVHKGEVIAEIDPRLFDGALLQSTSDLQNAKANVIAAKANLTKAKAQLVQAHAEYERALSMEQKNIGTQQALDQAKANYQAAQASVEAEAAAVEQANAQVSQKQAAVTVAQTNRNYTIIRSPIDGTVVARNVDVGQTVAASLQAPTIFTIAQDLVKMLVYAKVDESDVGRIRSGEQVTFKVDAFPRETFHGTVSQIRMNPTTVQNVVTYDAVIEFENRDLKLFPGMTAYVTIPVATAANVEKVPNAALRFKPPMEPDAMRAIYAKNGIDLERAEPPKREGRTEKVVVWKLTGDNKIEPVEVSLGITDHTYTEVASVLAGSLNAGDEVATTAITPQSTAPGQGVRR
ncbi:MAG TPA: efflux RND transporter periplasmic adaptor subunit [Thermoanaerobaculia bacterium]|nr:efflux RND transporter periplasmic adaptor subunit [Thermoanaerobaculia bacterium]